MKEVKLKNFNPPTLEKFQGKSDPVSHLLHFKQRASLEEITEGLTCKLFSTTFTEQALSWFSQLSEGSIHSFEQLGRMILEQYKSNCLQKMTIADLHLEQRYDENTRQFLNRFTKVTEQVHELNSNQAANFFVQGLINGSLVHEIFIETPPKDMNEVRTKVEGIIRVEENRQRIATNTAIAIAQNNVQNNPPKYQEAKKKLKNRQQQSTRRTDERKRPIEIQRNDYSCNSQKRFKQREESFDYTFTMLLEKIFAELKDQNILCTLKLYNMSNHLKDRTLQTYFGYMQKSILLAQGYDEEMGARKIREE